MSGAQTSSFRYVLIQPFITKFKSLRCLLSLYIYIYIYIYRERERSNEKSKYFKRNRSVNDLKFAIYFYNNSINIIINYAIA